MKQCMIHCHSNVSHSSVSKDAGYLSQNSTRWRGGATSQKATCR